MRAKMRAKRILAIVFLGALANFSCLTSNTAIDQSDSGSTSSNTASSSCALGLCSGCCLPNGLCADGLTLPECGYGGAPCTACPSDSNSKCQEHKKNALPNGGICVPCTRNCKDSSGKPKKCENRERGTPREMNGAR